MQVKYSAGPPSVSMVVRTALRMFSLCCRGTESLGVKLVDGPGRCAGRLEIQLGSESFRVAESKLTKTSLPRICNFLGCGNSVRTVGNEIFSPGSGDFFKWAVKCGADAKSISDCIQPNPITSVGTSKAVTLACEGEHAGK